MHIRYKKEMLSITDLSMDKNTPEYKHLSNDVRPHREKEWMSVFYQLSIPVCLDDVKTVMEFGPGRGLSGALLKHYGLDYYSADVQDHGAKPDIISSIKEFKSDKKFDLVCAFQVLEHNPPEDLVPHLNKMSEISNKYVYISLPYYGRWFSFNISINIPRLNRNFIKTFCCDRLFPRTRPIEKFRKSDTPHAPHWFEVGDKDFSRKAIKLKAQEAGLNVIRMFHSHSFPYHIFILMEKD